MTLVKKASYVLVVLALAGTIWLHLGPVVLAGFFSYMILHFTYRSLVRRLAPGLARWLALGVFLLAATAIVWGVGRFIRQTMHTLPQIAATAIPKVIALAESYGVDLPFDNVYELREVAVTGIKENANAITRASGLLTAGFFHVVLAVFVAILAFFRQPQEDARGTLLVELSRELGDRIRTMMGGFEKVLGAQVAISALYTACTLLFLTIMGFSHVIFLTFATFIFGVIPIVGNILSNTLVVAEGLTLSTHQAVMALVFLVLIHKSGYFLYGRLLGSTMKVPMWQTLLAILLGEVAMGVPGIILAPALLHYMKEELRAIPLPPPAA